MSHVLLIEDNPNLNQVITVNLKAFAGVEVIDKPNADDAIALLELLPSIDIIVCKETVAGINTAEKMASYIAEQDLDTTLIILGNIPEAITDVEDFAIAVPKENDWEEVVKLVTKTLGISIQDIANRASSKYISIPSHYFLSLSHTCCDVYIRIKKGPTEFQYVKRIHSGDYFGISRVVKYIDQGLENFYIPSEFKQNFANHVSDQIVSQLEDVDDLTTQNQLELISNGFNVAIQEISENGFNSATIQMSDAVINAMLNSRIQDPDLNSLMQKILNSPTGYNYQHAHIASVTASNILTQIKLDSPVNHQKLAFAAFFKDISLANREDLAKLTRSEELDDVVLTEEDWELVFTHALESAKLIRKHPEAPIDIDTIIKHHHGSEEGKGFRTNKIDRLPLLSRIFLISSEFSKELLKFKEEGGTPKPVINDLKKMYSSPQMNVIIAALGKSLKSK